MKFSLFPPTHQSTRQPGPQTGLNFWLNHSAKQPLNLALYKGIQDSLGFWVLRRRIRDSPVLDSSPCQWNLQILDSNLQKDSGFLKLYSGFQSPGFRILQENFPKFWIPQAKISWIPESTWGEKSLLWADKRIWLIDNSLSQRWGHRTRISVVFHRRYQADLATERERQLTT